jgi:hypothetical protein
MLKPLVERRSLYGVGFRKEYVIGQGGAPVWYLEHGGSPYAVLAKQISDRVERGVDPDDFLWKLTPFIECPGSPGVPRRYDWEREWRVPGGLNFMPDDVAFLLLPEADHDKARQFFADVEIEGSGPSYFPAYIDPTWEMNRIQRALKTIPKKPEPSPEARPWWT